MIASEPEGRKDFGRRRGVSQAHGQVTEPALVAAATDRRTAQALVEVGLAPGEKRHQRRPVQAIPDFEVLFPGRLREAVPGTDHLAVVAAVDAIADQRPQLLGNGALVLDGEVRDAAPRVELVRTADRLRRADVDAALAAPAMVFFFLIDGKRQVAVDLAEEE